MTEGLEKLLIANDLLTQGTIIEDTKSIYQDIVSFNKGQLDNKAYKVLSSTYRVTHSLSVHEEYQNITHYRAWLEGLGNVS